MDGGERKRHKEFEQHKRRRMVKHSAESANNDAPLFGKPIPKKDSELHKMSQTLFGDYNNSHFAMGSMDWAEQLKYLGVTENTPGTPIQLPHQHNIFDAQFRASTTYGSTSASIKSASSGHQLGISSRHQVAEPPKDKERIRGQSRHMKVEGHSKAASLAGKVDKRKKTSVSPNNLEGFTTATTSEPAMQPTNVLRVDSTKKKAIRPYRPIQTAPSIQKTTSASLFDVKSADQTPSNTLPTSSSTTTTINPSLPHNKLKKSHSAIDNYSTSHKQSSNDSHPPSSHKHKKLASIHPSVNTTVTDKQQAGCSETKVVVPIRKTSSAEGLRPTHGSIEAVPNVKVERSEATKKKEKKQKKPKRGKERAPANNTLGKSESNQTHATRHTTSFSNILTSSESHVTSLPVKSESFQLEPIKPRPGKLKITTFSDDVSMDSGDVQSMLQELLNPLPHSLVTPIITPVKKEPFIFPSQPETLVSQSVPTTRSLFLSPIPGTPADTAVRKPPLQRALALCSTSSDADSDMDNKQAVATAMSTLNNDLANDSSSEGSSTSSSSSGSSSDSSDSSSDEDETITPTLKKLMQATTSTTTITPLKKTPPHSVNPFFSLPDESANLSPPPIYSMASTSSSANTNGLISQGSFGFNPIAPHTSVGGEHQPQGDQAEVYMSDSDSSSGSDSNSGSESDSESSDSEDQTDGALIKQKERNRSPEDITFGGMDMGGFYDNDFLAATIGVGGAEHSAGAGESSVIPATGYSIVEHHDSSTQPFTVTTQSSVAQPVEVYANQPSEIVPQSQQESRSGKKRKRTGTEQQYTARKAPKLSLKGVPDVLQAEESGQQVSSMMGISKPAKKRGVKLVRESSGEEGEISSDTEEKHIKSINPVIPTSAGSTQLENTAPSKPATQVKDSITDSTATSDDVESLVVKISLVDIPRVPDTVQQRPKATVQPYNVRNTSVSKTPRRRNTADAPSDHDHDETMVARRMSRDRSERNRDGYRHREDYSRDYRRRTHRDRDGAGRWEREPSRDRWYRDRHREYREDYWSDSGNHYDRGSSRGDYEEMGGVRGSRQRVEREKKRAENFFQEARRRKHEADNIGVTGVEKAMAYMDSVVFFMRYGDVIECMSHLQWVESMGVVSKKSPSKIYLDTIAMIRHCLGMAGDCKPLVLVCLKCQSILYWRLFQLKQQAAAQIQKELQEYFIPPKGTHSKSPYPNSFSPLPSPASVGSTASNSSGGGVSSQDPSPSGTVSVPKHIFNKATEHLTITTYITQSFELWKNSGTIMDHCREFITKVEKRASLRIHQFCSIVQIAAWTEQILRSLRR